MIRSTGKRLIKMIANPQDLRKTKKVLHVNPTVEPLRDELKQSILELYLYDTKSVNVYKDVNLNKLKSLCHTPGITWLNVDVVKPDLIAEISALFDIHPLIAEDIISLSQRPKVDEIDNQIFCVMQMMYFSDLDKSIESEQVSFVLGKNFLLSFQDDETRDHFQPIRNKLEQQNSKFRTKEADFLLYGLLDAIVDNYYIVMDKLGSEIELLEEEVSRGETTDYTMSQINNLRKEMIMFRRNVVPVRDLISNLTYTDNPMISEQNKRYFKDVLDHVIQAIDLSENYRDIVTNIRDLYLNQINLKSNEVMKFLTIVTALLAPATVLGGIFGMNFDNLPWQHNPYGFVFVGALMVGIPILMLWWFRKKGWY
jgi:magnesium transporter